MSVMAKRPSLHCLNLAHDPTIRSPKPAAQVLWSGGGRSDELEGLEVWRPRDKPTLRASLQEQEPHQPPRNEKHPFFQGKTQTTKPVNQGCEGPRGRTFHARWKPASQVLPLLRVALALGFLGFKPYINNPKPQIINLRRPSGSGHRLRGSGGLQKLLTNFKFLLVVLTETRFFEATRLRSRFKRI